METVICNLCGEATAEYLYTIPDLLLEQPEVTARLVQCTQCRLIYQNPRPTLDEIGKHYPLQYESYADAQQTSRRNWLLRKAVEYGSWKRCRFIERHVQQGRILDIGCATGLFLRAMRERGGWDLHGIELSEDIAKIAREQHGLNVKAGTLEQAAYPDAYFDAVTMWDVLEHLHDPHATLLEIRRILKPSGVLVIRVPNYASWDARLFGPTWAGLDAPRHLYVFDPDTLGRLLVQSGYDVLNHSGGIGSYVTFVLSLRFWMRSHQIHPRWERAISGILYHPLARLLTTPIFYLPSATLHAPLLVTTARPTSHRTN